MTKVTAGAQGPPNEHPGTRAETQRPRQADMAPLGGSRGTGQTMHMRVGGGEQAVRDGDRARLQRSMRWYPVLVIPAGCSAALRTYLMRLHYMLETEDVLASGSLPSGGGGRSLENHATGLGAGTAMGAADLGVCGWDGIQSGSQWGTVHTGCVQMLSVLAAQETRLGATKSTESGALGLKPSFCRAGQRPGCPYLTQASQVMPRKSQAETTSLRGKCFRSGGCRACLGGHTKASWKRPCGFPQDVCFPIDENQRW